MRSLPWALVAEVMQTALFHGYRFFSFQFGVYCLKAGLRIGPSLSCFWPTLLRYRECSK
jgi:hypothetical protein